MKQIMIGLIKAAKAAQEHQEVCWRNYKACLANLNDPDRWCLSIIDSDLAEAKQWIGEYRKAIKDTAEKQEQISLQRKLEEVTEFGCVVGDVIRFDCGSLE